VAGNRSRKEYNAMLRADYPRIAGSDGMSNEYRESPDAPEHVELVAAAQWGARRLSRRVQ
jgi:hypothetical protein